MPFTYDYRPGWIAHGNPRSGGWHLVAQTQRWHLYDDLLPLVGAKMIRACDGVEVKLPKRPKLLHREHVRGAVCDACQAEWERLAALPRCDDMPHSLAPRHDAGTVIGPRRTDLPPVDPKTLSQRRR